MVSILSEIDLSNHKIFVNKVNSYENSSYDLKSDLVNFYGFNFSNTESLNYWQNEYLLLSTEFITDYGLIGFDIHAFTAGDIYLSVYYFSLCQSSTSCRMYFDYIGNSYFDNQHINLITWKINVEQGLNRVRLPYTYQMKKGYILYLKQNSTGRVSVDTKTRIFEDYSVILVSAISYLVKLNTNKFRFCINPLIDRMIYAIYVDLDIRFVEDQSYQFNKTVENTSISFSNSVSFGTSSEYNLIN